MVSSSRLDVDEVIYFVNILFGFVVVKTVGYSSPPVACTQGVI